VIKQDIIQRVADRLGVTKVKAAEVVNAFFEAMKESLKEGERIELRGFGVLIVKNRKTGIGRNPKTGEEVEIPLGKTVRFKPGKNLSSDNIH
jgi:DNA-binding protein HU-beta